MPNLKTKNTFHRLIVNNLPQDVVTAPIHNSIGPATVLVLILPKCLFQYVLYLNYVNLPNPILFIFGDCYFIKPTFCSLNHWYWAILRSWFAGVNTLCNLS